jgi:hypothetical protein
MVKIVSVRMSGICRGQNRPFQHSGMCPGQNHQFQQIRNVSWYKLSASPWLLLYHAIHRFIMSGIHYGQNCPFQYAWTWKTKVLEAKAFSAHLRRLFAQIKPLAFGKK